MLWGFFENLIFAITARMLWEITLKRFFEKPFPIVVIGNAAPVELACVASRSFT